MKNLALIIFLVALFEIGFGASTCKDEDIIKISKCYDTVYGNMGAPAFPYLLLGLVDDRNRNEMLSYCLTKKALTTCIGTNLIESCFNVDDIKKLPFADNLKTDAMAIILIASFIRTEHICNKIFKLSDADYKCYSEVLTVHGTTCSPDYSTCAGWNQTTDCVVEKTYEACGKVVGCFEQKMDALTLCYNDFLKGCHFCNGISATNNLIDGLCDDDKNL